ncbi:MAG TPA: hypothetical protein VNT30_18830 [Stellaceae bacterium]|nr:hypothetical protein [Stellaceae bacterium]
MARTSQNPKNETFNFRIDPSLKAAFVAAAEAEDKPAAQLVRDFMRAFVKRRERQTFETEARRQSRIVAERSRDPGTDDHASLAELDALFEEDQFADEWKA